MTRDDHATHGDQALAVLPEDVVAPILDLLTHDDLRVLVLCSKSLASQCVLYQAFSGRSRLHIPVSSSAALMDPLAPCLTLPTSYAVHDPVALLTISSALHMRVLSLKINSIVEPAVANETLSHPLTPLRSLVHLVDLEIETRDQRQLVDIQAIHTSAPQLTRLKLIYQTQAEPSNSHVLPSFSRLRVLELVLWEDWDMANVVGIPVLEEHCAS